MNGVFKLFKSSYVSSLTLASDIPCVEQNIMWRDNYNQINSELYEGFRGGNPRNQINEVSAGGIHDQNILHLFLHRKYLNRACSTCFILQHLTLDSHHQKNLI